MDRDKIKLIIRNIELLLDSLKSEIYYDSQSCDYDNNIVKYNDYDEIFEGYNE